jgi:hypothetical protein
MVDRAERSRSGRSLPPLDTVSEPTLGVLHDPVGEPARAQAKVQRAAPGHVADVRNLVIDALGDEQIDQLAEVGDAIRAAWARRGRWPSPTPAVRSRPHPWRRETRA